MKKKFVLFMTSMVVWSLLNWVPDWQHLVVGVLVSMFVTFLTGDLFISRPQLMEHPHRYWHFFCEYVPVFVWEVLKANIDVAYRVLHPQLPINPGIVKVKTTLKTDIALTFLANSITLTPGTMSVDIDKDDNILYVHWIDVKSQDVEEATRIIVERFEKILAKVFD